MIKPDQPFPSEAIPFLLKYAKIFKYQIIISLILIFAGTGTANLLNWFFAEIIETLKHGISEEALNKALFFVGLMAVCEFTKVFITRTVAIYRQKNLNFPMEQRITLDALKYLQGHSYDYIASKHTGSFSNKISQINGVQPIFHLILVIISTSVFEMIIKTTILLYINYQLGLMFLFCSISSYFFSNNINKKSERLHKMRNRIDSLRNGWLVDVISNLRFVKQFNNLAFEQNRLFALLTQFYKIRKADFVEWMKNYTLVGIYLNICSMIIITFSVYLWSKNQIGIGHIVFTLITLNTGLSSLTEFHDTIRRIRNQLSGIDEGLKTFADPHGIKDSANSKKLKVTNGEIEFKEIVFSYNSNKKVLQNFNLKISKKEKLGIVGISGSGKTTLINLLQRAYEPKSGTIYIDHQDISKVTQSSLHQNISLIPQETTLFHRSIMDNIAFGNPKAKTKQIYDAAKKAHADTFIQLLPDGYDSQVGDRGCKLSGGEKQRIAIARAILKDSPILILDEATSALDSESEVLISNAISKLIEGKTVIAIAHRLSTLKEMDRIIVLEKGKIVESGSYSQLRNKKGGKFNHFCNLQLIKTKKIGKV